MYISFWYDSWLQRTSTNHGATKYMHQSKDIVSMRLKEVNQSAQHQKTSISSGDGKEAEPQSCKHSCILKRHPRTYAMVQNMTFTASTNHAASGRHCEPLPEDVIHTEACQVWTLLPYQCIDIEELRCRIKKPFMLE